MLKFASAFSLRYKKSRLLTLFEDDLFSYGCVVVADLVSAYFRKHDFIVNSRRIFLICEVVVDGDDVSKGKQVKWQIDSGDYGIAICEHEGKVVGFITWKLEGMFGDICNNGALPGTGLKVMGQTMYKYVLDIFRANGVKIAKVTTGLDWAHAPARRAYERAGFAKHLDSTTYYMELD